jgi:nucleotide-binding universal stress UspA family protein
LRQRSLGAADQELIMTDTMLVGVDGSEASRRAADFAAARARAGKARLVVAYVIEWSPYTFNTPEENEVRHKRREEEIARAEEHLAPLLTELRAAGIEVKSVVRHGHAAQALSALAVEYGAAQIFVGRRGVSTIAAMLFGSVAGSLVQISPVPVTVVP